MNKSSVDQISTHPAVITTTIPTARIVPINFTADKHSVSPNDGAGVSLGTLIGSYDEHGSCVDDPPCDCGVRG